ncbi:MAG: carboxymuconolactone decarboxylase family protein [Bauldia sp.]|nr:carboxymuconolactone decarboxylase family protein [Bauldia sp.]
MFDLRNSRINVRASVLALAIGLAGVTAGPAAAADNTAKVKETYADIEKTFGGVPTFVKQMPAAALPGAWQELKDLELSEDTALSPKTKALISLAVSAQIPCTYCIWADTNTARQAGASDEEIGEAVAMAALTRHWSTIFNGLQVDLDTFKQELGGETAKQE